MEALLGLSTRSLRREIARLNLTWSSMPLVSPRMLLSINASAFGAREITQPRSPTLRIPFLFESSTQGLDRYASIVTRLLKQWRRQYLTFEVLLKWAMQCSRLLRHCVGAARGDLSI